MPDLTGIRDVPRLPQLSDLDSPTADTDLQPLPIEAMQEIGAIEALQNWEPRVAPFVPRVDLVRQGPPPAPEVVDIAVQAFQAATGTRDDWNAFRAAVGDAPNPMNDR